MVKIRLFNYLSPSTLRSRDVRDLGRKQPKIAEWWLCLLTSSDLKLVRTSAQRLLGLSPNLLKLVSFEFVP